jgi:hypothetical protein
MEDAGALGQFLCVKWTGEVFGQVDHDGPAVTEDL